MRSNVLKWLVLSVAVVALPVATVYAQEAFIGGTITDSTGGVLPGVTVNAVHTATGNTFSGVTDETGTFRLPVRVGNYRITAELSGFTTINRTLDVLVGQTANVNLQMAPSTVQESVTVTGEAPLVDTSSSSLGANIDPKQMSELPVNGRNFLDLAVLAPGARTNAVEAGGAPVSTGVGTFQINVDGQQVTGNCCGTVHQASLGRDAIAEFQFISNRFDAVQGRSSGVQVNVVSKSGTNTSAGTFSGYFRSDKFNAADFIKKDANGNGIVLPYQDQQLSGTFGGPIVKDKIHYFANYEYEREPRTITFTSPYPFFNLDQPSTRKQHKPAVRADFQFNSKLRLSAYANRWVSTDPIDPSIATNGGSSNHPAGITKQNQYSEQAHVNLTQVLNNTTLNEVKVGWAATHWLLEPNIANPNSFAGAHADRRQAGQPGVGAVRILLPGGYNIGPAQNYPQLIGQDNYTYRDDLTMSYNLGGRHDVKTGAEYIDYQLWHWWCNFLNGQLDATGTAAPAPNAAQLQAIFPVWNDPSTWNLAALSPVAVRYQVALGSCNIHSPRKIFGTWWQDDWQVSSKLTLNLGVRYDMETGSFANELGIPSTPGALGEVFLKPNRPNDTNNVQPRLGFAYALNDRTVIRGGAGLYYAEVINQTAHTVRFANQQRVIQINNPTPGVASNFAANPTGSLDLTNFEALESTYCNVRFVTGCTRRAIGQSMPDPNMVYPYSIQGSVGFQRQIGSVASVEANYVFTGVRKDLVQNYNNNLTYNPATGANYVSTDVTRNYWGDWGTVLIGQSRGRNNYHGLESSFTKRFSDRWQANGTYTFSYTRDFIPAMTSGLLPITGITLVPDLADRYGLASNDQRHRATFNGIWDMGYGLQLSGLYFYGSGQRYATTWGSDLRRTGGNGEATNNGRLRPNGTIITRNNFVGEPIHRVDMRLQKRLSLGGNRSVDGMLEVFNLFNHENFGSYTTTESSARYGQPDQNLNVAYVPRMMQLGFRVAF